MEGLSINVHVTEKDIRLGERKSPESCPVSIALCRTFNATAAVVAGCDMTIYDGKKVKLKRFSFFMPSVVSEFVSDFDRGKRVKPFSFLVFNANLFCSDADPASALLPKRQRDLLSPALSGR